MDITKNGRANKMDIKKSIIITLADLPTPLYNKTRKTLIKSNRNWLVGQADLRRFTQKRLYNKNTDISIIECMEEGLYKYDYFNICFLNDVLQFVLNAIIENRTPYISILNSAGINIWEMFFRQPYEDDHIDFNQAMVVKKEKSDAKIFAGFEDVYSNDMIRLWSNMYHRYVRFNDETKMYIKKELRNILADKRKSTLGVLLRGTDYTHLKPVGHPIQPEIDRVIRDAKEMMARNGYDYLYLATEDGRIDMAFRKEFGDKLLINKRNYYDELYNSENVELIKDVHFNRENDEYYKGVEYLSSLVIISKCDSLLAGNCGGTEAAVFMNGLKYKECKVYNLGLYE